MSPALSTLSHKQTKLKQIKKTRTTMCPPVVFKLDNIFLTDLSFDLLTQTKVALAQ